MTESASFLTPLNWLGLIHPVLIILFVYPVVGATIRLGILARERRLDLNPIAPTVPVEHADHGRWVTGGMVLAVLVALFHNALAGGMQGDQMLGFLLGCCGCCSGLRGVVRCKRRHRKDVVGSSLLVHPDVDCLSACVAPVAPGFPNSGLAVASMGWFGLNRPDVGLGGDAKADCWSALDATAACLDECCCCFVACDAGNHGDA